MYAALACRKNHIALYPCGLYCIPEFQARFAGGLAAPGRKLDMAKSCIRFRHLADLDLDRVAQAVGALRAEAFAVAVKR